MAAKRQMDAVEFEYCRAMAWIQVYAACAGGYDRAKLADEAVESFEKRFEARAWVPA